MSFHAATLQMQLWILLNHRISSGNLNYSLSCVVTGAFCSVQEQVDELIRDHPELAAFIDPLYCFLEADLNLVTRQQINNAVANFPQAAPGGGATIWSAPVTGPLTDCFVFNGPAGPAESSRTAFMSHMVTALGGNAFFGFISSNQPMKFAPGL